MVTLLAIRTETPSGKGDRISTADASEFYHYEDTGCEASDSCLDCPLPICRYDDPEWYLRHRRMVKDFKIVQIIEREHLTVEEAAERYGITVRTVFRIMQRCREASDQGTWAEQLPMAA